MDCLVGMDFNQVCQNDEAAVRKLADKWRQNFYEDVCENNDSSMVSAASSHTAYLTFPIP